MPHFSNLKEDVVHEGTNHSFKNVSLPPFLCEEEDVINDTPSQEIIVEKLPRETMVMFGSQQMIHVLCQVLPYPPLKDNDEHKERVTSSTIEDIPHLLIEDVSFSDEDIDQMVEILTYRYMETINRDLGKVQSV